MGIAVAVYSSFVTHSSLPVFESNARKRLSAVDPMNTSPPAVAIAPAVLVAPVCCLASGRASVIPRGTSQAKSPVAALTAIKRPHGGLKHGKFPATPHSEFLMMALNPPRPLGALLSNGSIPSVLPGMYFGFFCIHP